MVVLFKKTALYTGFLRICKRKFNKLYNYDPYRSWKNRVQKEAMRNAAGTQNHNETWDS